MKTHYVASYVIAVFSLTAFTTTAWARLSVSADASTPLAIEESGSAGTIGGPGSAAMAEGSKTIAPEVASGQWNEIKECTFDMRERFFAGLKRMEEGLDAQIGELAAKRATMKGTTSTKDWDFAMKEMQDARSSLKSAGVEAGKASPETWNEQKDKVGQAWVRVQEAYNKVRSSTTS